MAALLARAVAPAGLSVTRHPLYDGCFVVFRPTRFGVSYLAAAGGFTSDPVEAKQYDSREIAVNDAILRRREPGGGL